MIEPSNGYVKALFAQLVKAYGGQDAVALALGVSRQRIGQYIQPDFPAIPRIMDVWALEATLGRSIVHAGLANAITQQAPTNGALVEACEVSEAAAQLLHLARTGGTEREIHAAALRVQHEAADVPLASKRAANVA